METEVMETQPCQSDPQTNNFLRSRYQKAIDRATPDNHMKEELEEMRLNDLGRPMDVTDAIALMHEEGLTTTSVEEECGERSRRQLKTQNITLCMGKEEGDHRQPEEGAD